jgi:hypothetical protein
MQPMIRIAFLLMLASTPAFSADFEFKIGRASYTYDIMTALVETTNTSGKTIGLALITCAFMDDGGNAINIGNIIISEMPAGESRYDKPFILGKHDVSEVSCKTKSVSFR